MTKTNLPETKMCSLGWEVHSENKVLELRSFHIVIGAPKDQTIEPNSSLHPYIFSENMISFFLFVLGNLDHIFP